MKMLQKSLVLPVGLKKLQLIILKMIYRNRQSFKELAVAGYPVVRSEKHYLHRDDFQPRSAHRDNE